VLTYTDKMRREDRARFEVQEPFSDGSQVVRAMHAKLGSEVATLDRLRDAVVSDLDTEKFGIGWWAPYPDTQRRILISDQLVQTLGSLQTNLDEAALHSLEAVDATEQLARRLARAILPDGTAEYPAPTCLADALPERYEAIHVAGFYRSLGSVLDCLAATSIGVAAIPMGILRSDFSKTRLWLRGERSPRDIRCPLQIELRDKLEATIERAGPKGWIDWLDSYRNMLVHRARRVEINKFETSAYVVDSGGRPIPHSRPVHMLPTDPDRSDIEAMVEHSFPVLREEAAYTMSGVFGSVRFLVTEVARCLTDVWAARRANPSLMPQPREQWPDVRISGANVFTGYSNKPVELAVTKIMMSTSGPRRLEAAALTTNKRPNVWPKPTSS
jgi:hypothetical protein